MTEQDKGDGRFFAWEYQCQPWKPPSLTPQLVFDAGAADYKLSNPNTQARPDYRFKKVLEVSEYDLTLNQLIQKYPAPNFKT